jgi:hypothetical protein
MIRKRSLVVLTVVALAAFFAPASVAYASPTGRYGAISFAPSDDNIYYVQYRDSLPRAERSSISVCKQFEAGNPKHGEDCRGAVWVYNGWQAFASDTGVHAWGWGWASTQERAQYLAMYYCEDHGGYNCELRTVQRTPVYDSNLGTKGGNWT